MTMKNIAFRLKKREAQLKAKEELAEGLHLIDFEQLKIENQTYNEKIEERNEELLKLRKKITSTVQVQFRYFFATSCFSFKSHSGLAASASLNMRYARFFSSRTVSYICTWCFGFRF